MNAKPEGNNGRCPWAGGDPDYISYHDSEWGVPKADDRALFEKIVLEGFQAGLSWITILRKRDHFRAVFDGFDAERIARYDARKIEELMSDPGIVRNRAKIEATIGNARAFLEIVETTSFAGLLWELAGSRPQQNRFSRSDQVPGRTETSQAISKQLKKRGFRFVGPTTVYAFMQSVGMVNDHLIACPRHAACAKLAKTFEPPA